MSFYQTAQDYFNSPKSHKLPQDYIPLFELLSGFDVHLFNEPMEFFYHPSMQLADLDRPEIIEQHTMFLLFSSIATNETNETNETIWNKEINKMAHPTDYPSQKDISRLRKSPSQMNPNSQSHSQLLDLPSHSQLAQISPELGKQIYAKTLISNFLSSNPNWSLDSLYDYCMRQYADYGVSNSIIAECVKEYIEAKIS